MILRRGALTGWVRKNLRLAETGETLDVYFRSDDESWVETMQELRFDRLPGLERVDSAKTAIVHRGHAGPGGDAVYFKQYLCRERSDRLKNLVRPSRAKRALLHSETCKALGFHVAEPCCLAETYQNGVLTWCVLVTRAVENAPSLKACLQNGDRTERRHILDAYASTLAAWHAAGLYHGDLNAGNILVRHDESGVRFFWLDLERVGRLGALSFRRRAKELTQLNYDPKLLSRTERMYFWKHYAKACGLGAGEQEQLVREVIRRTRYRWRKRGWI